MLLCTVALKSFSISNISVVHFGCLKSQKKNRLKITKPLKDRTVQQIAENELQKLKILYTPRKEREIIGIRYISGILFR